MRAAAVGRRPYHAPQSTTQHARYQSAEQPITVRRHRPDYWLLVIALSLLGIGLIVVYSIGPALALSDGTENGTAYVYRQLIAIAIGFVLFAIAARVPVHVWRRFVPALLILAGIATLIALLLPLSDQYPAHRWIRFGSFSFQSVELVKFALLLWFASFVVERTQKGQLDSKKTFKQFLFIIVGIGIVIAGPLLVGEYGFQSDLGSAVVIVAMLVVMAFTAGLPLKRMAIVAAIVLIGGTLFIATSDYRQERFATFLNPQADCVDSGYQACQALVAIGSGGMIGLGLGNSVQAYGYLPEAENDSIFAIYAEKFGFIGVTVLLGLFMALFTRMKRIADRAPDNYSRLVVLGALVWLSTQAIMNIGAMIGLLPLKGITLPLVSYGGSSVLMVLLVLGLVFQISRYTTSGSAVRLQRMNREGSYDDTGNRQRLRGAHYTAVRRSDRN